MPRRDRPPRTTAAAAIAVALLLGGCGDLRLELPPPAAVEPDAAETLRQRAAVDAEALGRLARDAAALSADPAQTALLDEVAAAADRHLEALGGVYDPPPVVVDGVDRPTPSPTPAAPENLPPPTPDVVVAELRESAASARADSSAAQDGAMARLLAAVAVNRLLLADAVAAAAALPPDEAPAVAFEIPEAVPAGVTPADVAVLVQSEDALGLAWEVAAARSSDAEQDAAAARARLHRERAQAWADAGGLTGTDDDPRRASYDLPDAVRLGQDPAATTSTLSELEGALAEAYAGLVASAEPDTRSLLVDAVLDGWRERVRLGATVPAFPAVPELAA